MSHTFTGTVSGMTCGHCVASVTEELQELPGVTASGLSDGDIQRAATGIL